MGRLFFQVFDHVITQSHSISTIIHLRVWEKTDHVIMEQNSTFTITQAMNHHWTGMKVEMCRQSNKLPSTPTTIWYIQKTMFFPQHVWTYSQFWLPCINHILTWYIVTLRTDILQTTFSNAFSWKIICVFWFKFDGSLFLMVQLTINQH